MVGFFEGKPFAFCSCFYYLCGIIHPIIILTALPMAGTGALIFLMLFRMELRRKKDVFSGIDLRVLLDSISANYDDYLGCCCWTLPIALGYGYGGEAKQPLGVADDGGLIFSQLLTLLCYAGFLCLV